MWNAGRHTFRRSTNESQRKMDVSPSVAASAGCSASAIPSGQRALLELSVCAPQSRTRAVARWHRASPSVSGGTALAERLRASGWRARRAPASGKAEVIVPAAVGATDCWSEQTKGRVNGEP